MGIFCIIFTEVEMKLVTLKKTNNNEDTFYVGHKRLISWTQTYGIYIISYPNHIYYIWLYNILHYFTYEAYITYITIWSAHIFTQFIRAVINSNGISIAYICTVTNSKHSFLNNALVLLTLQFCIDITMLIADSW